MTLIDFKAAYNPDREYIAFYKDQYGDTVSGTIHAVYRSVMGVDCVSVCSFQNSMPISRLISIKSK